jgi:hypothetical protein
MGKLEKHCSNRLLKDRFLGTYRWCRYEVDSEWWRITELSFTCQ